MEGYLKAWRKMLEWEHYCDLTTFKLFWHLLFKANFKDTKYMGFLVPKGSLIIKENSIGDECGLTYKEVRTAMKKLISTGEVKKKTTNKFTVVTIVNYSIYQARDDEEGEQGASKGRTKGELRASIDKEGKNDKNILLSQLASGEPDERTEAKPKKEAKTFACDSREYIAAEYMAKKILARVPTYIHLQDGKREKTLQAWAKDIDLLLRVDKVDFEEFKQVLRYSQTDPFWQKNILSGKKLREQYGALLVRMAGDDE